ncbi:hypothetical protein GXW82_07785 [Streptacidiphilus sp. 4-A2]|nr:hypothetical protein [Streptacidiphilus sp. 4-A2]
MRLRTAVPVLAGALALGAVAAPAEAFAATAKPAPAKPVITSAVSPTVVVGLSGRITTGVTVSATAASGIKAIYAEPYPLALAVQYGGIPTAAELLADGDKPLKVVHRTATGETAAILESETVTAPEVRTLPDGMAGTWAVAVLVVADNGATTFNAKATSFDWQHADALTVKAPATAAKGAAVTVTGRLTRANWAADSYQGYASQWAELEFRKAGSGNWTTVNWVRTDKNGNLSVPAKVTASGSWRYVFPGNTPAVPWSRRRSRRPSASRRTRRADRRSALHPLRTAPRPPPPVAARPPPPVPWCARPH